ncbi:hypothetical protein [Lutispora thermophila]|uniref:Peptide zinc metalloprotease protein n=1 Tax=Lutispora thermophila DSM 19022 TaxID=1122184 RepID=A0A1M6DPS4_9FIRM|nr:hypothetical protein [Lutispora thermophila]SHI75221.1 hypothetical protein SAMN02745176_01222 [Lutispora thermophila DSM 19022]
MRAGSEYVNVFKNEYMPDYKNGNLIINKTSCYKVSKEVAYLISVLPEKGDKEEYLRHLTSLNIENSQVIFDKLIDLGVLKERQYESFNKKFKHIIRKIFNPQIQVLSSSIQEKLFGHSFLYNLRENTMLKLVSISVLLVAVLGLPFNSFFSAYQKEDNFYISDFFALLLIIIIGIMFHELGHSYMCSYCGIGLRPISFSVYLIYPVMFTNVSGIDELDLKQRILVNIAGLFAQGIYMVLLIILYIVTKYSIFLICINMLFYTFYFNFHPFMRTDGYWFFRDVLQYYENNKIGKVANNIYYFLYFLFTIILIKKGALIVKFIVSYFRDFSNIKLNVRLLMNLFYMYLVIILFRAITNRFLEFYNRFIRKKEVDNCAQ